MRNLRITSESKAGPEDAAVIQEALARFNVAATKHTYYSPIAIFLRDDRDSVLGGALGDAWGGWLDLVYLWVTEPVRGHGYGERLLGAAEEVARAHGCQGVFLETFGFQARPFYEPYRY
jgi:GNAT superfamily N-acetyltransferase